MDAQILRYFGPAARKYVSSSLLRAGAVLSEAERIQRFESVQRFTSQPADAPSLVPKADLSAVKHAKCIFVDLRAPAEQATTGKIRGALSLPFNAIEAQNLAQALKDRSALYVLYAGASSPEKPQQAGQLLQELGYGKVAALAYEDWVAAHAPIEHVAPSGAKQRAFASRA
ncbi:hypothetical protein WJX81_002887 [Elliptochloris bilobata]|uniref:Rhodanese domain-containing protein n=1 Tax=Elliptochloris bilobata TaxID=381761 RepID=A0AAW1SJX4_9CHLO